MTCQHEEFIVHAQVGRLLNEHGAVGSFTADVTIRCGQCGRPFQFLGLPAGVNSEGAATSIDGLEARLAICPQGEQPSVLDRLGCFMPPDGRKH